MEETRRQRLSAVNHNDSFDFDESALEHGVKLFRGAVAELLG